jgi:hypothetical protein
MGAPEEKYCRFAPTVCCPAAASPAALCARGDAAHTARLQRALARGFARGGASSGGEGGGGGRPAARAPAQPAACAGEEQGEEAGEAELPPLE